MATFLRLQDRRLPLLLSTFYASSNTASSVSSREQHAATTVQSAFRGFVARREKRRWDMAARVIQRCFAVFASKRRVRRERERRGAVERRRFHDAAAREIQRVWRGYASRKTRHDFYKRQRYLDRVARSGSSYLKTLRALSAQSRAEHEQRESEDAGAEFRDITRNLHHLLSTKAVPGIYNNPYEEMKPSAYGVPIEEHLRKIRGNHRARRSRNSNRDIGNHSNNVNNNDDNKHNGNHDINDEGLDSARGSGVSAVRHRRKRWSDNSKTNSNSNNTNNGNNNNSNNNSSNDDDDDNNNNKSGKGEISGPFLPRETLKQRQIKLDRDSKKRMSIRASEPYSSRFDAERKERHFADKIAMGRNNNRPFVSHVPVNKRIRNRNSIRNTSQNNANNDYIDGNHGDVGNGYQGRFESERYESVHVNTPYEPPIEAVERGSKVERNEDGRVPFRTAVGQGNWFD